MPGKNRHAKAFVAFIVELYELTRVINKMSPTLKIANLHRQQQPRSKVGRGIKGG
jgi:hypothetical protein